MQVATSITGLCRNLGISFEHSVNGTRREANETAGIVAEYRRGTSRSAGEKEEIREFPQFFCGFSRYRRLTLFFFACRSAFPHRP
jgi:hypothetical protein